MKTKVIKINRENFSEDEFDEASKLLREGALVAFPTETVYGLGGNALDESASKKIYAAKGRPSDNPLIVHIADIEDLKELAEDIPDAAYKLAEAFWPGPLTMILKKKEIVPYSTTGGLDTVAIRMPSDEIARTLIKVSGVYIAAPSANLSGRPSPTKAEHVIEDLSGRIDMIIDGGASDIGLESSIIDLTTDKPLILRPGYITKEKMDAVLGNVDYDKAVINRKKDVNIVAKAPGMKYKHYAPTGDLTIVEGNTEKVIEKINVMVSEAKAAGKKTAVLSCTETKDRYNCDMVKSLGSKTVEKEVASKLFDALREFDALGIEVIFSESFDDNPLGQAVMNRLLKAAGYQIIQA